MSVKDLNLSGIIAFNGAIKNGLQLHPDGKHILYPMGNKVTIKNLESGEQHFLTGHANPINAMCVSSCGKRIAAGEANCLGFKATVIIWNYAEKQIEKKQQLHKINAVEDICFSCSSNYLIILGMNMVVWDIDSNIIYNTNSDLSGKTNVVTKTNLHELRFVSAGENIVRLWNINPQTRKLSKLDAKIGKIKRSISCIVTSQDDQFAFCGATTGDIIKIRLNLDSNDFENADLSKIPLMVDCYSKVSKNLYSGGVKSLLVFPGEKLIVGAGDGSIELVEILPEPPRVHKIFKKSYALNSKRVKSPNKPLIKTLKSANVNSSVSSLIMLEKDFILVGTISCEIYQVRVSDFDMKLILTCHTDKINQVAFPDNYSEIFATCSKNDVRLWRTENRKELLRITVPNLVCSCVCFSHDGTMILTGWDDGKIRSFSPQTGRLIFTIERAHLSSVSAVTMTKSGEEIISGGCDAQVRIWGIKKEYQNLEAILKEHRGPITHLHVSVDDESVISSSSDGSCIIWDIKKQVRKQMLRANTMFTSAQLCPNEVQVLTCGSDKKISYWEILDGSLIRELEGSSSGTVNCLDITIDCKNFVSGANDFIVKCWDYELGQETHVGIGHAAQVTACKISPNGKKIVSASSDGTIIVWDGPFEIQSETPTESSPIDQTKKSQKNEKIMKTMRKKSNGFTRK